MGNLTVLVAEDEPDLRDLFQLMLEHEGLDVVTVSDGRAVAEVCAVADPALLVLDLTLPGLSGVEVIEGLRADPSFGQLPILVVTGLGRETGINAALAAGANDYVMKPFRPIELTRRVALLLSQVAP